MGKTLKLLTLLSFFCGLVLFVACSKDDKELPTSWFDGTITAVVENGNDYNSIINKVVVLAHAFLYYYPQGFWGGYDKEFVSANYSNGSFTVMLPTSPDAEFLREEFSFFSSDFKVSDKNAKICRIYHFIAYNNDSSFVGRFFYSYEGEKSHTTAMFYYADRDVTITGSTFQKSVHFDHTVIYNLSLKKGWNMVYYTNYKATGRELKAEISTRIVNGLKWSFRPS